MILDIFGIVVLIFMSALVVIGAIIGGNEEE